jgi:PAS domain S-box-containing protein
VKSATLTPRSSLANFRVATTGYPKKKKKKNSPEIIFLGMQGSEPSASQLMGDASSTSLHHNSQRAAGRQNLNVKPQLTRTQRRSSLEVFGSSSSSTTTLSSDGYHSGNSAHLGTYPLWGYDDNEQQQSNNIMQLFAAAKSELLYPVQTTAQKTSCTDEISDMIVEDTQEQMILELIPDKRDVFSGGQQQQDLHNSPTVEKVMKWERSPEREELTEAVMAERAAEWGLVLKSDSVTGKICGVGTRKLSRDRSSSSTGSGSRRRSSGNWTSEPGTSSIRTSMCTSTTSMCTSITSMRTSETSTRSSEASDTGSTNISSMMRSVLPLLSHKLKDVLSKFEHAFVISDATWREFPIIYASAGFFSLTGYSPQEVIGQNCRFLQGPGTDKKEVAKIRESIAAGKSFCGCILNYKKDGSRFWNLLSITPIKSSDGGQVLKYIGMQVEVSKYTESKREKMMRPNGLSGSLIQYDSRLQDKAMESVTELAAVFQKQQHPTIVQIESQLSNVVEGMTMGNEAPQKTRRSSGFLSLLGFFRKSPSSHEKEHMDTREIVMKAHGLHYKVEQSNKICHQCLCHHSQTYSPKFRDHRSLTS